VYIFRTLHHYINFIYNLSSYGKENAALCDYVHDFSEQIIDARKLALVSWFKDIYSMKVHESHYCTLAVR